MTEFMSGYNASQLSNSMRSLALVMIMLNLSPTVTSQTDSALSSPRSDSATSLNMDAPYKRPFVMNQNSALALGGYLEANSVHSTQSGVSDGLSFQMRRLTLFLWSSISTDLRFLTEIEFEDGTKEINLEFAALDMQLTSALNFRGGILMNPIGAFNQNHDGPKWEFVARPISAAQMLPATWSNVGFGLHGKLYQAGLTWGYESYLTNGFDESIIANNKNRTSLGATKENLDRFEESHNGQTLFTTKIAVRKSGFGEIGVSYMGGVYNRFADDGLMLDKKRRVDVFALDANYLFSKTNTGLNGEFAWIYVNVPPTYSQQYGGKQRGGFVDIVHPLFRPRLMRWPDAVVNMSVRFEYVDWNVGSFRETGGSIADDVKAVTGAFSFRPTSQTVVRLNYRHERQRDILGNPPTITALWQFGLASYF
jgi:hypothetical protein